MARLVEERHNTTGAMVYRMKMQEMGRGRMFCLTFDDRDEAARWIARNEEDFKVDPELFFDWREELYLKMKRRGDTVLNHIVMPRLRKQL